MISNVSSGFSGRTVLMDAAARGDAPNVERFLGELGRQMEDGETALTLAIRGQHIDCIRLLLPELPYRRKDGKGAFELAIDTKNSMILKLLVDHILEAPAGLTCEAKGRTPRGSFGSERELMRAVHSNDIDALRRHLDQTGFLYQGYTALRRAALLGHPSAVRELLVEACIQCERGWTALMSAAQAGHAECVSLLLYERSLTTQDGWTALMWAAWMGHIDCAILLLDEARKQNNKGQTAMALAARGGHVEVVRLLLDYESEFEGVDGRQMALEAARAFRQAACVDLLIGSS